MNEQLNHFTQPIPDLLMIVAYLVKNNSSVHVLLTLLKKKILVMHNQNSITGPSGESDRHLWLHFTLFFMPLESPHLLFFSCELV